MLKTSTSLGLLLFLFTFCAKSQNLENIAQSQYRISKIGSLTLGGWALANVGVGLSQLPKNSGKQHYFHQMNALRNTVNLGLATYGYFSAGKILQHHNLSDVLRSQIFLQQVFLVNGALDAGYVMTGLYFNERGKRMGNAKLEGYGNSLVLQGGFLLLFDATLYLLHMHNYRNLIQHIEQLSFHFDPTGGVRLGLQIFL